MAAFLVVKGYVIARGDLATALGILQYAGLTSVVVAGLLSSLPILAALMLGWIVFRMAKSPLCESSPGLRRPLVVVLLSAFVLSAFFTPVPYMVIVIVLGLVAGLIERRWSAAWPVWVSRCLVGIFGTLAAIAMLYTVWVPHEVVELRAGTAGTRQTPDERVGYVLADDPGGWITILTSGERTIVRFRDSAVMSITVCRKSPYGGLSSIFYASTLWNAGSRSLANLHPGTYIECPK